MYPHAESRRNQAFADTVAAQAAWKSASKLATQRMNELDAARAQALEIKWKQVTEDGTYMLVCFCTYHRYVWCLFAFCVGADTLAVHAASSVESATTTVQSVAPASPSIEKEATDGLQEAACPPIHTSATGDKSPASAASPGFAEHQPNPGKHWVCCTVVVCVCSNYKFWTKLCLVVFTADDGLRSAAGLFLDSLTTDQLKLLMKEVSKKLPTK